MKRKLLVILLSISLLFLSSGCGNVNLTAKEAVRDYLELYVTLDEQVIKQLDEYVEQENYTDVQKNTYKDILKRQYSTLNYTFINEKYDENQAFIKTKITVLDLAKVQNDATKYLEDNKTEFYDEDNNYNKSKFLDYKLEQMKDITDTIEYEIEFKVIKENDKWVVSQLSNDDLLKIHGVYEE